MTTCTTLACGVGGWTGPLPGDPSMGAGSITLRATAVFGGVNVSWTYPTINPEAVAHTLLYRGESSNFTQAIERAVVTGNNFYDQVALEKQLFYWIRMVSVNGTQGDLIGPAMVVSLSRIGQIIDDISGEIDRGVLAGDLTQQIDRITLNATELQAEIWNRINSSNALAGLIAQQQSGLDEAIAIITTEITTRLEGDNALATRVDILAVANANNLAAITREQEVRITADEAFALDRDALLVTTGANAAAIITERTARTTADSALSTRIDSVMATSGNAAALIATETTARIDADGALASQVTQLFSATGNNAAAIQNEATARTNADSSFAQQLSTTQTTLSGQIASVQTNVQTEINTINGAVTNIGARWTTLVDVNGFVGGFGIYNNGQTVEAGFNVDKFWIGRPGTWNAYPFIVKGNTVYMRSAMIEDASITTAQIANARIESAQINNLRVDMANITNLTVDTIHIRNGAITNMVAIQQNYGQTCQPYVPNAYTAAMALSINTAGYPVLIFVSGSVRAPPHLTRNGKNTLIVYRDEQALMAIPLVAMQGGDWSYFNSPTWVDYVGAGYHTYTMRIYCQDDGGSLSVSDFRSMTLIELKR